MGTRILRRSAVALQLISISFNCPGNRLLTRVKGGVGGGGALEVCFKTPPLNFRNPDVERIGASCMLGPEGPLAAPLFANHIPLEPTSSPGSINIIFWNLCRCCSSSFCSSINKKPCNPEEASVTLNKYVIIRSFSSKIPADDDDDGSTD